MRFARRCRIVVASFALIGCLAPPGRGAESKAVVLFDGKTTAGWKQCGPGSFEVKDGALVSKGGMGMLWHEKELGDFVLTLEWKAGALNANSGVFVRFPDPGNDPWKAVNEGYEIQIHDAAKKNRTGSVYNQKEATAFASKPPGEWNTYEIKAVGQQYTIKVNGTVVNEFTGKLGTRGFVGIQNHDDNSVVSVRNVQVVELAPASGGVGLPAAAPATKAGDAKAAVETPTGLVPGLVGEYFRDATELDKLKDAKPFLVRVDKQIHVRRAEGQFAGSKLATNFAVRWTGFVRVPADGAYGFALQSDDDSRLFVDEKPVVDKTGGDVQKPKASDPVQLTKGDHPIRVEFTQSDGPAGVILRWQQPGDQRPHVIPAESLFHAPPAEQIAWDKKGWDEAKFDVKTHGAKWEKMDYGPFLSHTAGVGEGNVALKGITIKLGKPDEAAVMFDTELLRYAGGWTGGFVNLEGVAFDGAHGPFPTATGDVLFVTKPEPGARERAMGSNIFDDPRRGPFGPLPREWGRYKGLYRNGDKVVLAYTVGTTEVREMPGVEVVGGTAIFTRTIQLGASDKPLSLAIGRAGKPSSLATAETQGVEMAMFDESKQHVATFPPRRKTTTYKIAVRRGDGESREADAAAMKRIVENVEDINALTKGGPALWSQTVEVKGSLGTGDGPYVVDTIPVPEENPYDSWIRFGGLDFFSDGRAALCTWSGDVWIASGVDDKLERVTWKRYASGLFQALGLKIVEDQVYVLGRDQITRLHDLNNDGEADFYECFNNDCEVSDSFHEFSFDLQTDKEGNFYFAKAGPVRPGGRGWETITNHNGCVLKVSKDGQKFEVFATGVRAPNGMGAGPNGEISVADNEGTWTPTCRLSIVKPGAFLGVVDLAHKDRPPTDYDKPICWLPHGEVDNSSGGQVWVTSDKWGPFAGEMLHLSYGRCALFKVLKEDVGDGLLQGGVVQFPLGFESGICRARFNAKDGQLYVAGLKGWQTTATKDAAFQRVRYTGQPVTMPTGMHASADGVSVTFTGPLDKSTATDVENYAVEQWNYLWSSEYGSPEVSVEDPTIKERDPMEVEAATLSEDGKTVSLKIPDLQPVMQQKIRLRLKGADGKPVEFSIFHTINKLGAPPGGAPAAAAAGK